MRTSLLTTPRDDVHDRHRVLRQAPRPVLTEADDTPAQQPGGISLAAALGAILLSQGGAQIE